MGQVMGLVPCTGHQFYSKAALLAQRRVCVCVCVCCQIVRHLIEDAGKLKRGHQRVGKGFCHTNTMAQDQVQLHIHTHADTHTRRSIEQAEIRHHTCEVGNDSDPVFP